MLLYFLYRTNIWEKWTGVAVSDQNLPVKMIKNGKTGQILKLACHGILHYLRPADPSKHLKVFLNWLCQYLYFLNIAGWKIVGLSHIAYIVIN